MALILWCALGSLFSYVKDLSVKKQDKALINARRARNIRTVLKDPKDTTIGSAQFRSDRYLLSLISTPISWFKDVGMLTQIRLIFSRFWVKKMFKLEPADSRLPIVSSTGTLLSKWGYICSQDLLIPDQKVDMSWGKTSRNPREAVQDLDASAPTVSTRRSW